MALVVFFGSLNQAFLRLFSLSLLIRTFFKPIKNEYRKGLVAFSIGMGMFIKSIIIFADVCLLFLLIALEVMLFIFFVSLPVATIVWILF